MNLKSLKEALKNHPETIEFNDVIALISEHYTYTPFAFDNGLGSDIVKNAAGTNEGSCKVFAFADDQNLTEEETPFLFGRYYIEEVLQQPESDNHANIRSFLKYGWEGITFYGPILVAK